MSTVYPQPPPPAGYPPAYQQQPMGQPQPTHNVVVVQQPGIGVPTGACPYCRSGHPKDQFTLLGILIAIIFFPWGIFCCLMMTERRCSNCNAKI